MNVITPNWPAPATIHAFTTTRLCWGENVSGIQNTEQNDRDQLTALLSLPSEPMWLQQTHGIHAVSEKSFTFGIEADAAYTNQPEQVCLVLTADCLPVLICDAAGKNVAAIHAGWRGLAKGVIENTVQSMQIDPKNLMVWLGPAIGPQKFEVGADVYEAFTSDSPECKPCFTAHGGEKWLANLYQLAAVRLNKLGINKIYGGEYCTHTQKDLFFSFRRDHNKTGRMASVIWIER